MIGFLVYLLPGIGLALGVRLEGDTRPNPLEFVLIALFWPYVLWHLARKVKTIRYKGQIVWRRKDKR